MFLESVLEAGVRLTVPLMLLGVGELVSERAGVLNIGLEGKMVAGAFTGFVVMHATGNLPLACLAAVMAGMLVAALMAGVSIYAGVNQILTGFALFIMVPGLAAFFYQQNFPYLVVTPALDNIAIPLLSDIPLIGSAFFDQNIFYYLAVIACIGAWLLLERTRFGLNVSACGYDPEAAASKGIQVLYTRTVATLFCGAMAGLGGVALTVGALGSFSPGVTGGRGFIAIAIVILGRWKLHWCVIAALAIGISDALRLRLGGQVDFPVQLLAMLPWLVVLAMLISGAKRTSMPKALGRTFGQSSSIA